MSKKFNEIENFIFICKDKDCKKNEAKALEKAFEKSVKSLKYQKNTKILECKCTGRCKEAPVAIINNTWLGNVNPKEADNIIEQYLKK